MAASRAEEARAVAGSQRILLDAATTHAAAAKRAEARIAARPDEDVPYASALTSTAADLNPSGQLRRIKAQM
jgi:hypothetical protein